MPPCQSNDTTSDRTRSRVRPRAVAACIAVALVAPGLAAAVPAPPTATDVAGEILIGSEPWVSRHVLAQATGATSIQPLPRRPDVQIASVSPGRELVAASAAERLPGVRWAAPHHRVKTAAPNDPLYRHQWNLGSRSRAAGAANWEPVNGTGTTGSGVTVAVIDTGVTPNPELDQVVAGFDFVDDDEIADDPQGHGTHVAGTIAQTTGNGSGAAGVAPDASIVPIRALDATGLGTYADIISAFAFATQRGARVINISASGPADGGICEAVARATAAGVVVVASAGNDAGAVGYPAACRQAIAVSATTITGSIASYSNRGPAVAIAAPGGDNTTDLDLDGAPDSILQYTIKDGRPGHYFFAGTSMAAPHVAGAAALILQVAGDSTPASVRNTLTATARDAGAPGNDDAYGSGLLDIAAAVASAAPSPTTADPLPPPPPTPSPAPPTSDPPPAETSPPPEVSPNPAPTTNPDVARLAGSDRFATAAAVSRTTFEGGANRVYLTSGRDFPDALGTGAIVGRRPGPVLLVEPCDLPEATAAELRRLSPGEIVVVGGESAVCSATAARAAVAAAAPIRRIAGGDRFATAAALAATGWSTADHVFVASGRQFPDSLGAGAAAAASRAPLLLTEPCALPEPTLEALERLRPLQVTVVGGAGAVCDSVADAIARKTNARVTRLAGTDRFATSAEAARWGRDGDATAVVIASGRTFPDGLTAGALGSALGLPLLLVETCSLPAPVREALHDLQPTRLIITGGARAVCHDLEGALADATR